MRILQNKIVLGAASLLIVAAGAVSVLQPTVVHADALVHIQQNKQTGDIAVFGSVTLVSGQPEDGVYVAVSDQDTNSNGDDKGNGKHKGQEGILASAVTGANGQFKFWITGHSAKGVHPGDTLSFLVRPQGGSTYEQNIVLQPGDIASVTITMSTPLIPVFPFTVFVY